MKMWPLAVSSILGLSILTTQVRADLICMYSPNNEKLTFYDYSAEGYKDLDIVMAHDSAMWVDLCNESDSFCALYGPVSYLNGDKGVLLVPKGSLKFCDGAFFAAQARSAQQAPQVKPGPKKPRVEKKK
jgi:hypothetical protein